MLDSGWKDAGSASGGTLWQEDEREEGAVSGAKWELGVGGESWEPALGLRLRGPEGGVAWAGLSASAPPFVEAETAASGLPSCWYGSLAVELRAKQVIKTPR